MQALMCTCSVTKSCPTLCDPVDYSLPGSSVLHCPPEFAQIRVHRVGDAIQPSHPPPAPSPGPLEEETANQYSSHKSPMSSKKRQKVLQLEPGNSVGQPTAIGIDLKIEC